jgi:hypothetical protein
MRPGDVRRLGKKADQSANCRLMHCNEANAHCY